MNVALMGSVSSSVHALEALIRGGVAIAGVLGLDESRAAQVSDYRALRPVAERAGLPFRSFVKVTEPGVARFLEDHRPDLLWVIGLSQLVPADLVGLAREGGVGFHPTMLPRGRGRAPVAWTIMLEERAAVSLFFLTDEPDAGDLIAQREVSVLPDDYSEDLIDRTNEVLGEVVLELAPLIKGGTLPRARQGDSMASYYAKRSPGDGLVHWNRPTDKVYRLVRAAGRPYPGAFAYIEGRRLTIWRAEPARAEEVGPAEAAPAVGTVILTDPKRGVLIRTLDGGLWLTETDRASP
jgi:methionyl-tRNA formyltransferase